MNGDYHELFHIAMKHTQQRHRQVREERLIKILPKEYKEREQK